MSEPFRDADHIRAAGDRDRCRAVAELVRMKVRHTVAFSELLKISCRGLWEHRFRRSILSKAPFGYARRRLLFPKLSQKLQRFVADIHNTSFSILGRVDVYALLRCVLQIAPYRDRTGLSVNIRPLEAAQLASARSGVSGKVHIGLPF